MSRLRKKMIAIMTQRMTNDNICHLVRRLWCERCSRRHVTRRVRKIARIRRLSHASQRIAMYSHEMRIAGYDEELAKAIMEERQRQEDHVELIASENYASPRVME